MITKTSGIVALLGGLAGAAVFAAEPVISEETTAEIRRMDMDRDGKLSVAEHAAGTKRMFGKMDFNGDGTVTAEEMDKAQTPMPGAAPDPKALTSVEKIKVMDTSKDGSLSAEEYATGASAMFTKMDKDKDGFLTAAELEKGRATMLKKK